MNQLVLEQLIVVQLANYINEHAAEIPLPCLMEIDNSETSGEQLSLFPIGGGKILRQYVDGDYIGNFPFAINYQLSPAAISGEYAKLYIPLWNISNFLEKVKRFEFPYAQIQSIEMTGLPVEYKRESDGVKINQAKFNLKYYKQKQEEKIK